MRYSTRRLELAEHSDRKAKPCSCWTYTFLAARDLIVRLEMIVRVGKALVLLAPLLSFLFGRMVDAEPTPRDGWVCSVDKHTDMTKMILIMCYAD